MKRISTAIASAFTLAVIGAMVATASPTLASAAPAEPTCYKTGNGAKVCVTVATPTPAPSPTPRVVYRIEKITVKVPIVQRVVVVKKVPVVQRVMQRVVEHDTSGSSFSATGYPSGGRFLSNGFYELAADGRSYDVGCNPYAFCLFLFPKGAKIQARGVQDAAHWDVPFTTYGPDDRALIAVKVKSMEPFAYPGHAPHDIHTQLVVTTDKSKWPYIVSLYTSNKAPSGGTKIAFYDTAIADDLAPRTRGVSSKAPALRSAAIAGASLVPAPASPAAKTVAAVPAATPTLPPVPKPCSLEGPTLYFVRGMGDFAPTNVFDDTLGHTCIAFPKDMQNAPVVLLSSPSDGDAVINSYPWSDGLFVVGTPDVLILQDGSGKGSRRIYVVKDAHKRAAGTVSAGQFGR
jgi:hypothetical protein